MTCVLPETPEAVLLVVLFDPDEPSPDVCEDVVVDEVDGLTDWDGGTVSLAGGGVFFGGSLGVGLF